MSNQNKMKAAVYYKYGSPDIISIATIAKPVPKDDEVLVQIKAASVNAYDWHLLRAKPFFTRALSGLFKPKNNILGADIAGIVAATGNKATKFKVSDEVFGCLESCGKGGLAVGGFAEYVCAKESVLDWKSPALSFAEACALPMASVTALQGLRQAQITRGASVLINGASGGVGGFAVQIAKAMGAKVTGICSSGSIEFVRSLGADTVIAYSNDTEIIGDKLYDAVIDIAATLSVKQYRRALKAGGSCVVIGFSTIRHLLSHRLAGKKDGKRISLCMANNNESNVYTQINKLIEAGQLKAVIDSCFPLEQTAAALFYMETGHPQGKVVIIP